MHLVTFPPKPRLVTTMYIPSVTEYSCHMTQDPGPEPNDPRFPDGLPPFHSTDDIAARRLNDTEWLVIRPQIFTYRLAVMTQDDASIEHWCFPSPQHALLAWAIYVHDSAYTLPVTLGWTRHVRRDHTTEYPVHPGAEA